MGECGALRRDGERVRRNVDDLSSVSLFILRFGVSLWGHVARVGRSLGSRLVCAAVWFPSLAMQATLCYPPFASSPVRHRCNSGMAIFLAVELRTPQFPWTNHPI
mgnify:FL=1|jgi:hypothetical protein